MSLLRSYSKNRGLTDQISPRGLIRQLYVMESQILDHMTKTQKETQKDQRFDHTVHLVRSLGRNDYGTGGTIQIEQSDTFPNHESIKYKEYNGGKVEKILSLILHKVKEHDKVLNEIKENVLMSNQMPTSYFISIQLQET